MPKVAIHESVTNTKTGGVDWSKLETGDIVACIFQGNYHDPTVTRYVLDPNQDHPEALSWHKLLAFPPSGMVWHHLGERS